MKRFNFFYFIISLKTLKLLDLGYNSDDADFEYYLKLKSKEQITLTPG